MISLNQARSWSRGRMYCKLLLAMMWHSCPRAWRAAPNTGHSLPGKSLLTPGVLLPHKALQPAICTACHCMQYDWIAVGALQSIAAQIDRRKDDLQASGDQAAAKHRPRLTGIWHQICISSGSVKAGLLLLDPQSLKVPLFLHINKPSTSRVKSHLQSTIVFLAFLRSRFHTTQGTRLSGGWTIGICRLAYCHGSLEQNLLAHKVLTCFEGIGCRCLEAKLQSCRKHENFSVSTAPAQCAGPTRLTRPPRSGRRRSRHLYRAKRAHRGGRRLSLTLIQLRLPTTLGPLRALKRHISSGKNRGWPQVARRPALRLPWALIRSLSFPRVPEVVMLITDMQVACS